jgi:hypothetical protein
MVSKQQCLLVEQPLGGWAEVQWVSARLQRLRCGFNMLPV